MDEKKINTCDYWEDRFLGNWVEEGGDEQTLYFANITLQLMPEWLKKEINDNKYSICDAGCGRGQALSIFKKTFPNSKLSGFDFSTNAITYAQAQMSEFNFFVADFNAIDPAEIPLADIIYCSNVLEHFEDPLPIFEKLASAAGKYLLIMIPFREESKTPEHKIVFVPDNIPLTFSGFFMLHGNTHWDTSSHIYCERQCLLVYAKQKNIDNKAFFVSNIVNGINSNNSEILRNINDDLQAQHNDLSNQHLEVQKNLAEAEISFKTTLIRLDETDTELKTMILKFQEMSIELKKMEATKDIIELNLQKKQNEVELLKIDLNDWQNKHDNLYKYSCKIDSELAYIKNSWTFKTGNLVLNPLRFARNTARKATRIFSSFICLDKASLKTELVLPIVKIYNKITSKKRTKQLSHDLYQSIKGKTVIVIPPTLDWNMPLFQRPHQLAKAYAKRHNTVALFLTPNSKYDDIDFAEKPYDNLWVLNSEHYDQVAKWLNDAEKIVLSISWTPNKIYIEKTRVDYLIYEYIDELEIFYKYGHEMEIDHAHFINIADVTVATATKLYDQIIGLATNPILSTNGGDYEFFSKTHKIKPNNQIIEAIIGYKAVIGYYGAIAKWFDYGLVSAVAKEKPEWVWVLIGVDYDESLQNSGILKLPNVKYLGPQLYDTLPSYLTAFDVATIPFVINEITLSTSPVKLFEYMAGGKPILASNMPECLKYKSVYTYNNVNDFITLTENILAMDSTAPYWSLLEKEALENTWDAKVEEILKALPQIKGVV